MLQMLQDPRQMQQMLQDATDVNKSENHVIGHTWPFGEFRSLPLAMFGASLGYFVLYVKNFPM